MHLHPQLPRPETSIMVSKRRTSQVRPKFNGTRGVSPKRALDDIPPLSSSQRRTTRPQTHLLDVAAARSARRALSRIRGLFARPYQKFTLAGEPRGGGRRVAVGASAIVPTHTKKHYVWLPSRRSAT